MILVNAGDSCKLGDPGNFQESGDFGDSCFSHGSCDSVEFGYSGDSVGSCELSFL